VRDKTAAMALVSALYSAYVERDEARAERDAALNHLQAVREFAHGLGASTASRAQILDACTRMPFAPEHGHEVPC